MLYCSWKAIAQHVVLQVTIQLESLILYFGCTGYRLKLDFWLSLAGRMYHGFLCLYWNKQWHVYENSKKEFCIWLQWDIQGSSLGPMCIATLLIQMYGKAGVDGLNLERWLLEQIAPSSDGVCCVWEGAVPPSWHGYVTTISAAVLTEECFSGLCLGGIAYLCCQGIVLCLLAMSAQACRAETLVEINLLFCGRYTRGF